MAGKNVVATETEPVKSVEEKELWNNYLCKFDKGIYDYMDPVPGPCKASVQWGASIGFISLTVNTSLQFWRFFILKQLENREVP